MKLKLNKSLLFSFIAAITFFSVEAQININTNPYWEGEIKLEDGTVKKGYVMVPNSPKEKYIAFKPSLEGKKETFKRKLVESVEVVSETGYSYTYHNIPAVLTIKGKASIGTSLLLVKGQNNYVTFYVESEVYKVDKKEGKIILLDRYIQTKDLPLFSYYIRKRGKPKANMFAQTGQGLIGLNAKLKKSAKYHLTEDKSLVNKITDGELKHKDIHQIITMYLQTTETM